MIKIAYLQRIHVLSRTIMVFLLTGLVVLIAACDIQAPGPDKSELHLVGTVRNIIDGARLEGAEIRLLRMKHFNYSSEETIVQTTTNYRGEYRFDVTVQDPDCRKFEYRLSARKRVGNLLYFSDGSYTVKCDDKPRTINVDVDIDFYPW